MSRISLYIDELVLNGFEPGDRDALVNGLRTELASILSDPASQTALSRSRRTPVLRLGRVPLDPHFSGAHKLGGRIARAIGKGLKA